MAAVGDNFTTYIYVFVYYYGAGSDTTDYNMTIYQYSQKRSCRQWAGYYQQCAAAHLAGDMWHTMYTGNYQMTQDGNGHNAGPAGGPGTGPGGVTIPSVSEWLPRYHHNSFWKATQQYFNTQRAWRVIYHALILKRPMISLYIFKLISIE